MFSYLFSNYSDIRVNHLRNQFPNFTFTNDVLKKILNLTNFEHQRCLVSFWATPYPTDGLYCNQTWDKVKCWPTTPANTTAYGSCPPGIPNVSDSAKAMRSCGVDGEWMHYGWTNYTECLQEFINNYNYMTTVVAPTPDPDIVFLVTVLKHIYLVGFTLSLIMLGITMFIFCFFKSLRCNRITIHQHLVMSFIIRFVIWIIVMTVGANDYSGFRNIFWLCRGVVTLYYYSMLANMFWMFVEGLYLHNRVAVSVFNSEMPFYVYYIIGWGVPALVITPWIILSHFESDKVCWEKNAASPYFYIIVVPIGIVLLVNCVFLFNIIRILVTKLRANNTFETAQVRKAAKAMIVLFPLLGITQVLIFVGPEQSRNIAFFKVYRIFSALLHPAQGMFVALIYCFLNAEVRAAIKKWWQRHRLRQLGGTRNRRRSSRTSSLFLSQTEVLFLVAIRRHVLKRRQSETDGVSARSVSGVSEITDLSTTHAQGATVVELREIPEESILVDNDDNNQVQIVEFVDRDRENSLAPLANV